MPLTFLGTDTDNDTFQKFYEHCFLAKCGWTKRTLRVEDATALWRLILTKQKFPMLEEWCLLAIKSKTNTVTSHTWSHAWHCATFLTTNPTLRVGSLIGCCCQKITYYICCGKIDEEVLDGECFPEEISSFIRHLLTFFAVWLQQ